MRQQRSSLMKLMGQDFLSIDRKSTRTGNPKVKIHGNALRSRTREKVVKGGFVGAEWTRSSTGSRKRVARPFTSKIRRDKGTDARDSLGRVYIAVTSGQVVMSEVLQARETLGAINPLPPDVSPRYRTVTPTYF